MTTVVRLKPGNRKKKVLHSRTATRFCEEANISAGDELDLASFIVAAQYIGTDATTDQLSDIFMDMEDTAETGSPREMIKKLLKKVDEEHGTDLMGMGDLPVLRESESDDDDDDDANTESKETHHEILRVNPFQSAFADDFLWQEKNINGMIGLAQDDQNLVMAQNLLEKTTLTKNEIANITGIDIAMLDDYESDSYETDEEYEEDEDFEEEDGINNKKKTETPNVTDDLKVNSLAPTLTDSRPTTPRSKNGVTISSGSFSTAVSFNKTELQTLDELIAGGTQVCSERVEEILQFLVKLKEALSLPPMQMKRIKTLAKLKIKKPLSPAISVSADGNSVVIENTTERSSAAGTKAIKFPAKFRVIIYPGALAKKSVELDSAEVGKLPLGTLVVVEEIVGRRCRITLPVNGWCSIFAADNRVIFQKEGSNSKDMRKALQAERGRQTKVLILKSITTLNDATVTRILQKCDWNLRRAIESFYTAKYQTQAFLKKKEEQELAAKEAVDTDGNEVSGDSGKKGKKDAGWWNSWKKFTKNNR